MEYMQSQFPLFSPASVTKDGSKFVKKPRIKGWLDVTEEQSAALARFPEYRDGHYMFLTGKANNIIVIDIDRFNPDRQDHVGKIDGLKKWDELFPNIDYTNSLIVLTPSGGRHIYCEYDEEITSKEIAKNVLIDILSDGKAVTFGPLYQIIQSPSDKVPPLYPEVKMHLTMNMNNFGNVITTNNYINNTLSKTANLDSHEYKRTLTRNLTCEISKDELSDSWIIKEDLDNKCYQMTTKSTTCCVDNTYNHSEPNHSCLYVRKMSVIANCFRHGKKIITGIESRNIRDLFFDFSNSKGIIAETFEDVLLKAESENLFRNNGNVFRRINNKKSEMINSYEDFLMDCLEDNIAIIERPSRFKELMIAMEKFHSKRFPIIKCDKRFIGFDNGILNIVSGELVDHIDSAPRHYIDGSFQLDDLDTPLFDKVIMHQIEDDDVYTYMLALIGRLFYDVGQYDNLDVIPLVIGNSGTGKSTLAYIISNMFDSNSVGSINSTHELIFGLQSLHDKEIIIVPEVDSKMEKQLSSSLFKMIVCGENISVSFKYGKSKTVKWKTPLFMCGNQYLGYRDDKGSISRRLAIFKFDKYVEKIDSSLKEQIVQKEMPKLVVKCLYAYRRLLEHTGHKGFWETCPEYFRDNIEDMNQCTDYVYMFLTLPPGDNVYGNKNVYFMRQQGSTMLLQEFKNRFMNYMRFRHPSEKYRWNSDYSSFHKLGYDVTRKHICKACGSAAVSSCCAKYHPANRSKKYIIENIVCIEEYIGHSQECQE